MSAWLTSHPRNNEWVNKLITQLKVISKIERGDKIYTESTFFTIEKVSLLQGLKRTFIGENRTTNLERISKVIDITLDFLHHTHADEPEYHRVQIALVNAVAGLQNLAYSYEFDRCILAQLDTLIDTIGCSKDDTIDQISQNPFFEK